MSLSLGPMGPGFFIFFQHDVYGGDDAPTLIVYDEIPRKTVETLQKKIKKYEKKKQPINEKAIKAIVGSMVDALSKEEIERQMQQYRIDEQKAIEVYRNTLMEIMEDDIAMILIFAEL